MEPRRFLLGIVILALGLSGCGESGKTIMPKTGNIPLTVWVVLGPGETFGASWSHRGCRLDEFDIEASIDSLKSNSDVFGTTTNFQWDPANVKVIVDNALLPFTPSSPLKKAPVACRLSDG